MIQLRLLPTDSTYTSIGRIRDTTLKTYDELIVIDIDKPITNFLTKPQLLIATEQLPLQEGWHYNDAVAVKKIVFVGKEDITGLKSLYGEIPSHLHRVMASSSKKISPEAIFADSDLKLIVDFYNKNNQTLPNIELEKPKDGIVSIKNANAFAETGKGTVNDGSENRKKAMEWWNTLAFETKFYHTINHNNLIDGDKTRHPATLTGREIELIYKAVQNQKLCSQKRILGKDAVSDLPYGNIGNAIGSEHLLGITSGNNSVQIGRNASESGFTKLYTEQDFLNALHYAELKHNKDYTKIWKVMHEYLTNPAIKR